ncbi:anaphase-promoting complex subunit 11 [Capsicum galapagoense]
MVDVEFYVLLLLGMGYGLVQLGLSLLDSSVGLLHLNILSGSYKTLCGIFQSKILAQTGRLTRQFRRWHAVSSWTWDAQDETCGICRMAFDGCCPDCKLPGDDCPLIWGACNHAFHLHCILKWVNSQSAQAHCPMCRREWQFKE